MIFNFPWLFLDFSEKWKNSRLVFSLKIQFPDFSLLSLTITAVTLIVSKCPLWSFNTQDPYIALHVLLVYRRLRTTNPIRYIVTCTIIRAQVGICKRSVFIMWQKILPDRESLLVTLLLLLLPLLLPASLGDGVFFFLLSCIFLLGVDVHQKITDTRSHPAAFSI